MEANEVKKGLYGVVVDDTTISKVMPDINSLTYRGYAVQDLCEKASFIEVAYLLLKKKLPSQAELDEFVEQEKSHRALDEKVIDVINLIPENSHPMDMVRTVVSFLSLSESNLSDLSETSYLNHSLNLFAKLPTIIAYLIRKRKNLDFIEPNKDLDYVANFFNMCFGSVPDGAILKAFDVSMILYAEHSFNASTFTSRVITSSLSDYYGAICGGIASLKGPLHGGANEAVMHMLLEIGEEGNVEQWVREKFDNKKVIMGFGHRVYKKGDSRVPTMKKYYVEVANKLGKDKWLNISNKVEQMVIGEKGIHPNLDFPAGPVYYLMGFDIDFFTPLFVMSRVTGWSAHIIEQNQNNKLIRPLSNYTGKSFRDVEPMSQR